MTEKVSFFDTDGKSYCTAATAAIRQVTMVNLKDYQQPDFWIRETTLNFDLREEHTRVRAKLRCERRAGSTAKTLVLNGEHLQFVSCKLDGAACENTHDAETLSVTIGDRNIFYVETEVLIEPQKNLACEGLYRSSGMFCTQCEAESFRKITYYVDRPDVMSVFTVTIEAEKAKYPILLSNGNKTSSRELSNGRHEVTWHDPFKKPAYLFALVAGDLGCLKDTFKTQSGRDVALEIYCRKGMEKRCLHAMDSLKKSMRWDEERYGLEYDLDVFMIVVADDFNMGAMENKGLNVFNAHYVLAEPSTATDIDFDNIQAVVGHEYFHNWTGNRVTCRDWFQLSLKEGLTVYRDQEFSSDLSSRAVKRIEDVVRLRTHQFAEDAGPMAHPVRPQSYVSIDNFYTLTIYEKGAEVIRMIETLIGRDLFRKGMDKYFALYDGQAVTTDDFVYVMETACREAGKPRDFSQFKNWYDQAGTPTVRVKTRYLADTKKFEIQLEQSCGPSPGQPTKKPYVIPVAIGLIARDPNTGEGHDLIPTRVLELTKAAETFVIDSVNEKPVLSLLRGFSAPIKVEYEQSIDETAFLIAHDSDPVARWEATQQLMIKTLTAMVRKDSGSVALATELTKALGSVLAQAAQDLADNARSAKVDCAFVSFMSALPSESYIAQFFKEVDVDAIFDARESLMKLLGRELRPHFDSIYSSLNKKIKRSSGDRALMNSALGFLCISENVRDLDLALKQRRGATEMTLELGALGALNSVRLPARTAALEEFKAKWKDEALVMNKWLSMRATAPGAESLDEVKELIQDPVFDRNNPNKIYSLLLTFAKYNTKGFHKLTGEGYKFIADQVLDIDSRNPQVASRLVSAFNQWKTLDSKRRALIEVELKRIAAHPGLSNNVGEIVGRALT